MFSAKAEFLGAVVLGAMAGTVWAGSITTSKLVLSQIGPIRTKTASAKTVSRSGAGVTLDAIIRANVPAGLAVAGSVFTDSENAIGFESDTCLHTPPAAHEADLVGSALGRAVGCAQIVKAIFAIDPMASVKVKAVLKSTIDLTWAAKGPILIRPLITSVNFTLDSSFANKAGFARIPAVVGPHVNIQPKLRFVFTTLAIASVLTTGDVETVITTGGRGSARTIITAGGSNSACLALETCD